MHPDARGLVCSSRSANAVAHFDATIGEYLGFGRATGEHLKAALAADPDFVLAHCLRGYFFLLFARRPLQTKSRAALAAAEEAARRFGATEREQLHLAALRAWSTGDLVRANQEWEKILAKHPRDVLALRLAHHAHFYLGESVRMRDSVARVLPAWEPHIAGFGFVLGMYAFGLEESGEYAQAEHTGRRAIEIAPQDIWAGHAVAHVMEMQCRHREGIAWIADLMPHWAQCNNITYHLWWHRCLFHLELEDYANVLDLYDREVRADKSEEFLDLCNAISLLWRLEDFGIDVGSRWRELADKAEKLATEHVFVFGDLHFAMALAAAGREAAFAGFLESLRNFGAQSDETEARIAEAIGVPLAEAILAFRRGEYRAALDLVLPFRHGIRRIGGSHAQRDVFERLLILGALRANRFDIAHMLLIERTAARPQSPWTWRTHAAVLDGLADSGGAAHARAMAASLLTE